MNQILIDGDWAEVDESYELSVGELYRIEVCKGGYQTQRYSLPPTLETQERNWRDSELLRTDQIMLISDHSKITEITTYRQALRDYPASKDFPNGSRPIE